MPQAAECSRNSSPLTTKIPAARPTTAPLISFETFALISALASSISSRTSSEARSETSVIACAIDASRASAPGWATCSAGKALEQEGEGEATREGSADDQLGALGL